MGKNIEFNGNEKVNSLELSILEKIKEHDKYNEKVLCKVILFDIALAISMTIGTYIYYLCSTGSADLTDLIDLLVVFIMILGTIACFTLAAFGAGMFNLIQVVSSKQLFVYFNICSENKEFKDFFIRFFNARKMIKCNDCDEIDSFFLEKKYEGSEQHKIDIIKKALM